MKAGDDPDVYAFVTALGFDEHRVTQLRDVICYFP